MRTPPYVPRGPHHAMTMSLEKLVGVVAGEDPLIQKEQEAVVQRDSPCTTHAGDVDDGRRGPGRECVGRC